MAETYDQAIAAIAARTNGNGGEKLNDVIRALSASHSEAKGWHEETSKALAVHINTERATLHGMNDMLAALEGKSTAVAAHIEETLREHSDTAMHMTPEEFSNFMSQNIIDATRRTDLQIKDSRRRATDQKIWNAKRVAKYVGGVVVVALTGLFIAWGGAYIADRPANQQTIENHKIILQLQKTNDQLLKHIQIDNDREIVPSP